MKKPIEPAEVELLKKLEDNSSGNKHLLLDGWHDFTAYGVNPWSALYSTMRLMFAGYLSVRHIGSGGCKLLITLDRSGNN